MRFRLHVARVVLDPWESGGKARGRVPEARDGFAFFRGDGRAGWDRAEGKFRL